MNDIHKQLLTFDKVDTIIYQLQMYDFHRGQQPRVNAIYLVFINHSMNWNRKSIIVLIYDFLSFFILLVLTQVTFKLLSVFLLNTWTNTSKSRRKNKTTRNLLDVKNLHHWCWFGISTLGTRMLFRILNQPLVIFCWVEYNALSKRISYDFSQWENREHTVI